MKKTYTDEPKGLHLEWVPKWEGVLKYCPDDLKNDVPLRFWHCYYHKKYKRRVCYELKTTMLRYGYNKNKRQALKRRRRITVHQDRRIHDLCCSILTMRCKVGPDDSKFQGKVVDHINNNTLDDRPSNLQLITQLENCRRSKRIKAVNKLSNEERHRQCMARIERMNKLRLHIMATMGPGATSIDVEIELAQRMQEEE